MQHDAQEFADLGREGHCIGNEAVSAVEDCVDAFGTDHAGTVLKQQLFSGVQAGQDIWNALGIACEANHQREADAANIFQAGENVNTDVAEHLGHVVNETFHR
jgi:hypothetical protein